MNPFELSIFLHKYASKHNQILSQVLKVDKENPIKQTRKKYFLCHLFNQKKISNIAYLWVAKVCAFLGLAVNIKVKLECICAGVFSQCNDYQMSVRDLFYWKKRDLSKSDHVCGSESCHKQRRLMMTSEKELMSLIRLEQVTKPISKEFGLHKSTVRQIVYKWRKFMTTVTFVRSGWPTKISPKQNI